MTQDDLNPDVAAAFLIAWLRLIHDGPEMGTEPVVVDDDTAKLAIDLVNSFAGTSGLGPIKAAAFDDFLETMNIMMTQGPQPGPDEGGPAGQRFPRLCVPKRDPDGQIVIDPGTGQREWTCFYV